MSRKLRIGEAGELLGVSSQTVRRYCEAGKISFTLTPGRQRVFDEAELKRQFGIDDDPVPVQPRETVFYVRSSNGNDVTMETQEEALRAAYGEPTRVFSGKSSGLNENRRGLRSLLEFSRTTPVRVCVTNKDRPTRFGFAYLEEVFSERDSEIVVLGDDTTKKPHEVLIQDFMSLLASFSGKFYRLRGWEQQKRFLSDVNNEVRSRAD